LNTFSRLVAGSGFATNLAIVAVLAATGAGLMWPRFREMAVIATLAFWLLDWFLIQDFGLFGGLGTDPNSALPICLLVVGGYLAVLRPAVAQAAPPPQVGTSPPVEPADQEAIDEDGRRPSARSGARPRRVLGVVSVVAAIGVTLLGAVPMAVAAVDRTPSPILAESLQGTGSPMNTLAPPLHLVDQRGRPIGLSDFRGRAVLLTFLDPVCTTDCPIIASEFVQATRMLGSASSRVALVAVVANPIYHSLEDVGAFDRQEGLDRVPNWYFLTGTVSQLRAVWKSYDMQVVVAGGGQMIVHSEVAYVIDPSGHIRWIASDDPGPATTATKESFAALMANDVKRILAPT